MQENEINKQLNEEYDSFFNSVYKSSVDVPDNIIELFKKSIMVMPPFAHKINFHKIKVIVTKDPDELSNSDLQDIIKVILNTPLKDMYDNFLVAIAEHLKIEKFVLSYNQHIEKFQKSLESKKKVLQDLTSGVRGNGMRIIPKA